MYAAVWDHLRRDTALHAEQGENSASPSCYHLSEAIGCGKLRQILIVPRRGGTAGDFAFSAAFRTANFHSISLEKVQRDCHAVQGIAKKSEPQGELVVELVRADAAEKRRGGVGSGGGRLEPHFT